MTHLRFQFKLLPLLGLLAGLGLFVYLGMWQSGKGDRLEAELNQRAARNQLGAVQVGKSLVDAAQLRDAPIVATGEYEPQHQVFLDNRQYKGLPGVHVIVPLRIDGSDTRILVNRGWIGWSQGRGVLPVVATPTGRVQITGLALVPSTKKFFLMPDHPEAATKLWSRLDLARFVGLLNQPLQPVVLLQTSDDGSALVRRWDPPEDRVGMHRGYAFQWFGIAVALLIFFVVASVRQKDAA
ncbi:MAG: SURF1 family protein [Ilumatobacteraceae bacterium]|jgi:surfeit locus 1 family protein|nr:SURF1 family protein [Ilumatobacteraceae bacterium]